MTYDVRPPEFDQLSVVMEPEAALTVASAPGGWRSLTPAELHTLGLSARQRQIVMALQDLVSRSYPELTPCMLASAEAVAKVCSARLGGLEHEVVLAIAVDGRNQFQAELELARGGLHGAALTPRDVLRPLVRASASAFILVHNHPSGDPAPSVEDIHMTREVARAGAIVGIPLLDHVIIGARGGGWISLFDLGVIDPNQEKPLEYVAE